MGMPFRVDAFCKLLHPMSDLTGGSKTHSISVMKFQLQVRTWLVLKMTTVLQMHMPLHQKVFIFSKFSLLTIIILYKLSKTHWQKRHLWRTAKNPMWFFVNEKCLGGTKAVKMFNVRFHSQSRKNYNSLEDSQGTISKPKYNFKKHSCFI